ncbi:MAG: DUF2490 domain-containing protein [Candidatus Omnitrophica bacterium]|nr:DUF2490 domain-containing protein [Candidatus Omnitrophota bacterium]MDD5552591.1 DUF2490 domain-containing protein [Candidatus Omnitrophota bacterium]
MKRRIFVIVGLVLFLTTKVYAYDDGDFQIWHTENQEFKINKGSKITLEEEFRWADDAGEFFYHHYDAGFVYSINKHLDLGANYRQVYEKKKGDFREENRPHLNAALKYDVYGFKIDDRNRIEYRHFEYQADAWRYRNKFTIKFPWKFTKLQIQPYLADEIFLDLQNKAFSRNRFYSGVGVNVTKNIKGEVFYLLQSSRSGKIWVDSNVLGTKLKILF